MDRSVLLPFSAVCALFVIASCATPMLSKKDAGKLSGKLSRRVYVANADLKADFSDSDSTQREVFFKKGEQLKLMLEYGDDYIKIKAVKAADKREQAIPRTIVFLMKEDVAEDADTNLVLQARLDRIVQVKTR